MVHSSEEEDLRGDENIHKTGSVALKGWCRPERRSHVDPNPMNMEDEECAKGAAYGKGALCRKLFVMCFNP